MADGEILDGVNAQTTEFGIFDVQIGWISEGVFAVASTDLKPRVRVSDPMEPYETKPILDQKLWVECYVGSDSLSFQIVAAGIPLVRGSKWKSVYMGFQGESISDLHLDLDE